MDLHQEGLDAGASIKAVANLFGICSRTLKRWDIAINALEHRHSGIKYVTQNQRHYGQADAICEIQQQTYEQAFRLNPQRWTQGPRDWSQPVVVKINHPLPPATPGFVDQCNL